MKYPLSVNELELLLRTVDWLIVHLREIISVLQERQGDQELLKFAQSAHGHLETLLDHLQRHHTSLGETLRSGRAEK